MQDTDKRVRAYALKKLTDQDLLVKIALDDKDPYIRKGAIRGITEQAKLAEIALFENDHEVSELVFNCVN